jgi:hypothetical protein
MDTTDAKTASQDWHFALCAGNNLCVKILDILNELCFKFKAVVF